MKIIVLLLFLVNFSLQAQADNPAPQALVLSADKLSSLLSDGFENETKRRYLRVDYQPDDRWSADSAYLVFVSFEGRGGSNNFVQWVALFTATSEDVVAVTKPRPENQFSLVAIAQVGGKMWRILDVAEAVQKGDVVEVPAMVWQDSDPGCCPSAKVTRRIRFQHGKLVAD